MHKLYCAFLLLACFASSAKAQNQEPLPVPKQTSDKPLLFTSLPTRISISKEELRKLFEADISTTIHFQPSNVQGFQCTLIDKVKRDDHLQSVNMILPSFDHALFTLSQILNPDNTIRYAGRVIHPRYGDAYQLTFENNQYYLDKQKQRLFMVE